MLYLDNAATSVRKPFSVYKAMLTGTLFNSVNAGRGGHKMSVRGADIIVSAQDEAAELFNIKNPQNIAFMPNATYGLNLVILGMLKSGGHAVVTCMEHNSVLRPIHLMSNYTLVWADDKGYVNPQKVREAIREDTCLIVCTHASNVCGSIQPVCEIGKIANENNIPFLVDAAQSAGCIECDVEKMKADFLVFSGHKGLMGPLGSGGVYVRDAKKLSPVITGGTGSSSESLEQPLFMPDMLHSGTMNVPAIKALGEGIKFIRKTGVNTIYEKEKFLADKFEDCLKNMGKIKVYGGENKTGTVAFNIVGKTSGETAQAIGDKIALRAGYHCAPLAHKALGTEKTGAVRASFGFFNKKSDVERAVDAVWKIRDV